MLLIYVNDSIIPLQTVARLPDGMPDLGIISGTVRVYWINGSGNEIELLASTPLIGARAPRWYYVWKPATIAIWSSFRALRIASPPISLILAFVW